MSPQAKRYGRPPKMASGEIMESNHVRLPMSMRTRIDDFAVRNKLTRADAIRQLIEWGLDLERRK